MEDHLHLEVELDQDGAAELFATVQAGAFSGHSSAWFKSKDLANFGRLVAETFPLTKSLGISGGFYDGTSTDTLSEEHLSIDLYPIGNCGRVGCQVRLASSLRDSERPQSKRAIQVELEVTYAELQRFGPALIDLASGKATKAVLRVAKA
jgi:hypothetical protein